MKTNQQKIYAKLYATETMNNLKYPLESLFRFLDQFPSIVGVQQSQSAQGSRAMQPQAAGERSEADS